MLSRERRLFFLRWLSNPVRVGVPIPSSKRLARAMAGQLHVNPAEYVIELGPGTGVVTKALLATGILEKQLVIIERDKGFVAEMHRLYPHAIVIHGDARHLRELLHQHGIRQVAAIVSSLPLLSMPDAIRHAIVQVAFSVIKPEGAFIQYTYGLMSPIPQEHQRTIGIHGAVAKSVWHNFPPARVWRYTAGKRA